MYTDTETHRKPHVFEPEYFIPELAAMANAPSNVPMQVFFILYALKLEYHGLLLTDS
jgi:hypothetical protein